MQKHLFRCWLCLTRPATFPNEYSSFWKQCYIFEQYDVIIHHYLMISLRQHITQGAVGDNSCAAILMSEFSKIQPARELSPVYNPLTSLWCPAWLFPLISARLLSSHTLSVSPYLSLTHSSKWAWHASHCLTMVCVCGRCLGRWNLLWDTLISSKPRPGQGGTGQVSGTTRYTPLAAP